VFGVRAVLEVPIDELIGSRELLRLHEASELAQHRLSERFDAIDLRGINPIHSVT
jgi:hypothetical protein